MFRFTLRELLLTIAVIGLTIGWWVDHRQHVDAADDAKFLAEIAEENGGGCNCWNAPHYVDLCHKYGVKSKYIDYATWEELAAKLRKSR